MRGLHFVGNRRVALLDHDIRKSLLKHLFLNIAKCRDAFANRAVGS